MKLIRLLAAPLLLIPTFLLGQVKINEVLLSSSGDQVELKNFGTSSVDVSSMWLCSLFGYTQISTLTVISGVPNIPPGGFFAVSRNLNNSSADLGLYNDINNNTGNFALASFMEDFVQWGGSSQGRESVAVSKGIWQAGDFVPTPADGHSLEYDGDGNASSDWFDQDNPTIGSENGVVTSVARDLAGVPDGFILAQNYPNPFNPSTTIEYTVANSSNLANVTLNIHNVLGQKIRNLINRKQAPGLYTVQWDGKNDTGNLSASGVYFYRLQAGNFIEIKKMILIQ